MDKICRPGPFRMTQPRWFSRKEQVLNKVYILWLLSLAETLLSEYWPSVAFGIDLVWYSSVCTATASGQYSPVRSLRFTK